MKPIKNGAKHAANIVHRLEMDVFSQIGTMPIANIKPIHLLSILRLVEGRGAKDEARRLLQYCGQIFRYAVITERAERDITVDLKGALRPYQHGHHKAIEAKELPEFLATFQRNDARLYPQTRHALHLMMLTFVRTAELIGARWEEFDYDGKQWNIPAERMKMKRPHVVPLAKQTIELLAKQKELMGYSEWVFPNIARPRKHMSDCTILGALKRLGYRGRMTGHGFRALAMSTIKEKLRYNEEVKPKH
jgi:integrase